MTTRLSPPIPIMQHYSQFNTPQNRHMLIQTATAAISLHEHDPAFVNQLPFLCDTHMQAVINNLGPSVSHPSLIEMNKMCLTRMSIDIKHHQRRRRQGIAPAVPPKQKINIMEDIEPHLPEFAFPSTEATTPSFKPFLTTPIPAPIDFSNPTTIADKELSTEEMNRLMAAEISSRRIDSIHVPEKSMKEDNANNMSVSWTDPVQQEWSTITALENRIIILEGQMQQLLTREVEVSVSPV